MDQNTLLVVLIVFVAISAVALLMQAVALIGIFVVVRQVRSRIFLLWPQIERIVGVAKRTTEDAGKHLDTIGKTSTDMLGLAQRQLVKVDGLLDDASTRAKVQMERAEMVLDDTMTRFQSTVSVVQRSILRPIREVHGLVSGIRTAVQFLGRSSRSTVDHATSDEEMFI
jgi:hypothetical protein